MNTFNKLEKRIQKLCFMAGKYTIMQPQSSVQSFYAQSPEPPYKKFKYSVRKLRPHTLTTGWCSNKHPQLKFQLRCRINSKPCEYVKITITWQFAWISNQDTNMWPELSTNMIASGQQNFYMEFQDSKGLFQQIFRKVEHSDNYRSSQELISATERSQAKIST